MIEFNLQRVNLLGEQPVNCKLSYEKGLPNTMIHYFDQDLGEMAFNGSDLFSALTKLRKYLEGNGFIVLCAGAMPNTYPSRMSRQMSNGRKAYIHSLGFKPDNTNIIDIFEPVVFSLVGTIADQEKFIKEWHSSISG